MFAHHKKHVTLYIFLYYLAVLSSAAAQDSQAGAADVTSSSDASRRLRGDVGRRDEASGLDAALQASLDAALAGDEVRSTDASAVAREIDQIEASLRPTFEALPKNEGGRISHQAASYLVHKFFVREHRWHIQGLGLSASAGAFNATAVDEAAILKKRAPAVVATMTKAREAGLGLTLRDAAAMATILYKVILEDTSELLHEAYKLNGIPVEDQMDMDRLYEVFLSYSILIFGLDRMEDNRFSETVHNQIRAQARKITLSTSTWPVAQHLTYSWDLVLNQQWAQRNVRNPFIPRRFTYAEALQTAMTTEEEYGPKQDDSCQDMKEFLVGLDAQGMGRVDFDDFNQAGNVTTTYHFEESLEELRLNGALDESVPGHPKVIISNYVLGSTNCYRSSLYRTFCCLSECDDLMNQIEHVVQESDVKPEALLELASSRLSESISPAINRSYKITPELKSKLRAIADLHGGAVPIHGRLFAQWLHFAFPLECPYPHAAVSTSSLTPSLWLATGIQKMSSSPSGEDGTIASWSDEELLPLIMQEHQTRTNIRRVLGLVFQVCALLVALRVIAYSGWRQIAALQGVSQSKVSKHMV